MYELSMLMKAVGSYSGNHLDQDAPKHLQSYPAKIGEKKGKGNPTYIISQSVKLSTQCELDKTQEVSLLTSLDYIQNLNSRERKSVNSLGE